MSTPEDTQKSDLYAELGVESRSTVAEIMARVEEERERSNRFKKIPKRRSDAEGRLSRLAEIERVLLDPSARAVYDSRRQAGVPSSGAVMPAGRSTTLATAATPHHELAHFCTSCGATLPDGANFCEDCSAPVPVNDPMRPEVSDASAENRNPDDRQPTEIAENSAVEVAETKTPIPVPPPPIPNLTGQPPRGPSPFVFVIPIVLLAVLAGIWFFNRKSAQSVVVPPVPGQVTDLRPPQVSLLNHPIVQPSPVASWDSQNIQGSVTIKSEKDVQTIVYPNGTQFTLNAKLFSAAAGSAAFSQEYGTVVVESAATGGQDASSTWQVQFQAEQAKDINGDGFPEIVLSDFSGGAHCCTTLAVISLRPLGPFIVFDEDLGSGGAAFKDIDGDGRREIRYDHLFEYALGSFAQGTFSVPVIYSAAKDGVYRVNTRAFAQLMSNEYEAAAEEHQKTAYDAETGAMEEDRDLINMFFRAYLGGRGVEGFEALTRLKPLVNEKSATVDPRAILEDALKKVAPEVLQQPEWAHIKLGPTVAPERAAPNEQQAMPPSAPEKEQQSSETLPTAPTVTSTSPQSKGVLHYHGPPIHLGERIYFSNLPGVRLKFAFDHQAWQPLISRQPDGTQRLTLRSLKPGEQTQCEVSWEVIE